jgi:hypothetical protein
LLPRAAGSGSTANFTVESGGEVSLEQAGSPATAVVVALEIVVWLILFIWLVRRRRATRVGQESADGAVVEENAAEPYEEAVADEVMGVDVEVDVNVDADATTRNRAELEVARAGDEPSEQSEDGSVGAQVIARADDWAEVDDDWIDVPDVGDLRFDLVDPTDNP